jgi:DNA-binding transcriptional LysR family regulator
VELRHLRYFVVVAEMENVSRAATEKLHVAQPSLRRQIRDLEDELGVQLFERTGKRVNLTDAGRLFLREARTLLEHTDEVVSKVRAFATAGEKELHVGYSPALRAIVSSTLRLFQQQTPKVCVKLHDLSNKMIITGLCDGRLQLAFRILRQNAVAFTGSASRNYSGSNRVLSSRRITPWRVAAPSRWPMRQGNLS